MYGFHTTPVTRRLSRSLLVLCIGVARRLAEMEEAEIGMSWYRFRLNACLRPDATISRVRE